MTLHCPAIVALVQRIERLGIELFADRERGRILYRPPCRMPCDLAVELGAAKWRVMRYLDERDWLTAVLDRLHPDDASDLTDVIAETFATRSVELNESDEHAARIALDTGKQWLADRVARGEACALDYIKEHHEILCAPACAFVQRDTQ